jgi:hypothetical protein
MSHVAVARAGPWHHAGPAVILGLGANAALEDVTILTDLHDEFGHEEHEAVFAGIDRLGSSAPLEQRSRV